MTVPMTVRITEELKQAIEEAAALENLPMNRFVAASMAIKVLARPELADIPLGKAGRPPKKNGHKNGKRHVGAKA